MNTVYYDAQVSDDVRRQLLYEGQLFVYSPRPSSLAFCEFARGLIQEAFGSIDAEMAQHSLPVEDYAAILGKLKPQFIHHPRSKQFLQAIYKEMGCDLDTTYTDVPKMRSSTSGGYLTTGIAFAWHPHRDTWYSAPDCQLNWWMPIYDFQSENAMAFHPAYWNKAIRNDSLGYNYYELNKHRAIADQYIKKDPRPFPKPTEEIEIEPQIRLICPVGGIIVFSGAQLHSSVPNISGKTRFSIDVRTVHLDDVMAKRGAPNVDAECTGTTMRDYLRCSDFAPIPNDIVSLYDDGTELGKGVELVYQPSNIGDPPQQQA